LTAVNRHHAHLQRLETDSIDRLCGVVAEPTNPVMPCLIGKDRDAGALASEAGVSQLFAHWLRFLARIGAEWDWPAARCRTGQGSPVVRHLAGEAGNLLGWLHLCQAQTVTAYSTWFHRTIGEVDFVMTNAVTRAISWTESALDFHRVARLLAAAVEPPPTTAPAHD
jgi:hypothetical protein